MWNLIKECVIAGLGVALLPEMTVVEELRHGRLIALPGAGPAFSVFTQLCWYKDQWFSPALQAFIDVIRTFLNPSSEEDATQTIGELSSGDGVL